MGATAIYNDITEFKALQSELVKYDRLNLVSQMAAGVAHEIRNPMTVVKGYLQVFQGKMPERFTEQFQLVLDELSRIEKIVTDFLSLAKNKSVEFRPSNLNDILLELSPLLLSDGLRNNIDIKFCLGDRLPMVQCDTSEIKQLILNLCRNGIQAMAKGELSLSTLESDECVLLKVKDHGCGIPEDKLEHIFDPFYTTKDDGTGLGLPVCRSIVERHNGKIHVVSEVGKGTEFVITFPAWRNQ